MMITKRHPPCQLLAFVSSYKSNGLEILAWFARRGLLARLISSIQVLGQSCHYIPYSVISNMAGIRFAGSAMTSRSRLVATACV
jgi:hypothetical protein